MISITNNRGQFDRNLHPDRIPCKFSRLSCPTNRNPSIQTSSRPRCSRIRAQHRLLSMNILSNLLLLLLLLHQQINWNQLIFQFHRRRKSRRRIEIERKFLRRARSTHRWSQSHRISVDHWLRRRSTSNALSQPTNVRVQRKNGNRKAKPTISCSRIHRRRWIPSLNRSPDSCRTSIKS